MKTFTVTVIENEEGEMKADVDSVGYSELEIAGLIASLQYDFMSRLKKGRTEKAKEDNQ